MKEIMTFSANENKLYEDVRTIIEEARANAVRSVDYNRVIMYWKTGRRVFEEEQEGKNHHGAVLDIWSYVCKGTAGAL